MWRHLVEQGGPRVDPLEGSLIGMESYGVVK